MITYVYETIPPLSSGDEPVQFEHRQAMDEAPLTRDPVSGYPVKRVVSGGLGFSTGGGKVGCCGGGCGCGH